MSRSTTIKPAEWWRSILSTKAIVNWRWLRLTAAIFSRRLTRVRGFQDVMAENGLKAKIISTRSINDYLEGMKSVPRKLNGITGIFGINDLLTIQLMTAFRDAGYEIPQQVSFVGFDDSLLCEHLQPRLTSVNQLSAYMASAPLNCCWTGWKANMTAGKPFKYGSFPN